MVIIYVDDLIITGDNAVEIEALKRSLHQTFAIKDLGRLKYFLGIEMATSSKGLLLHQRKYVLDLLQEANMLDCKPAITPSSIQMEKPCIMCVITNSYYGSLYISPSHVQISHMQ